MNYSYIKKSLSLLINALPTAGSYVVEVYGILPDETLVDLEIEVSECYSKDVLMATIDSYLEEIFDAKYNYNSDEEIDEDDLLFDGGVYK